LKLSVKAVEKVATGVLAEFYDGGLEVFIVGENLWQQRTWNH